MRRRRVLVTGASRGSRANPLWGAPRIHGELLKLGLTVSQATVSKYMPRPPRPPPQVWRTFLKNRAQDLIALDFFTAPTATFRVLFVLVVLRHGRRPLRHFNITKHPTAEWTARQLIEACEPEASPRYLIGDRDQGYGERFSRQARMLDIQETVTAPRSPWQNAYAERVIGSIRRECLDHVVVIGRAASAGDPVELRRLLQRDPHTLSAGQRCARAAECAGAEPGQGGGGATRGWTPSRIPPACGVSRSDE
jgi:transposase InsO family protein